MNIIKYAAIRFFAMILQILGAIAVIISITSIINLDPTVFFSVGADTGQGSDDIGSQTRSPEEIEQFRRELGLDRSVFETFWDYTTALFTRGDLGSSWYGNREPVSNLYFDAFFTTLKVFGLGILIFTILAIVLGILAARRLDGTLDKNVRFSTSLFYSFPSFVLGTLLFVGAQIYYISGVESSLTAYISNQFQINAKSGVISDIIDDFIASFTHATVYQLLPLLTVVMIYTGFQFRLVRIYMSDVLNQNYIRTAHAKGLEERTILIKHGLRNALPELITSIATTFPVAFSGVVVLEKVFSIEGSGLLLIDAGLLFDWPVLIGGAVIFISLNAFILAVTDLIVNYIDPQLRLR